MTQKLAPAAPVELKRPTKLPKTPKPAGGQAVDMVEPVAEGYMSNFMMNPNANPFPPTDARTQWKQQVRKLIIQYSRSPDRLAILADQMGPTSAEAAAYKFIQNPAGKIPMPPGVAEDAAGVGVVKGGKDPRYMTATMGDQNAVTGDTLNKEMQAFKLVGRKSPASKTRQQPVKGGIGRGL
jgi:hypothetical protein